MTSPIDVLETENQPKIGNIKDIVEENRLLLSRNIILTDSFYSQLRDEKILSETMIRDIKTKDTQDTRNSQLLDLLQLITTNKAHKFVGILQKTGHHFLHEFITSQLEESQTNRESQQISWDVFKKIPALERALTATVKHQLANYIQEKVKEERVQLSWRVAPREKEKVMKAKVQLIEQAISHKDELEGKSKEVRNVEDKLTAALERLQDTEKEVMELRNEFDEQNDKQISTIKTLNSFTHASEAEIDRLKERMGIFDSQVKRMNIRVRVFLNQGDEEYAESLKGDPENVRLSKLERNVEKLIRSVMAANKKVEDLNSAQRTIRKLIMKAVGGKANDLVSALHIFQDENEVEKQTMLSQVKAMDKLLAKGRQIETGKKGEVEGQLDTEEPEGTFHPWRDITDSVHDKVIQLEDLMARLTALMKRPASKEKRAVAVVSPSIDYQNFVSVMELEKQTKPVLPPIKSPDVMSKKAQKSRQKAPETSSRREKPVQAAGIVYQKSETNWSRSSAPGTRSPSPIKSPDKNGERRLSIVEMAFPDMSAPPGGRVLKGVKKSNSMEINKKKYDLEFFEKTAFIGQKR